MDADLQHPPQLIRELIAKWQEGYDVVYTVRRPDKNLSLFKRASSSAFYSLMNQLTEHPIDAGAADFRLLDRKVVDIIASLHDPFLFLRGLIPWMGFRQFAIAYEPDARLAGKTKYSLVRMARLALHGATSFSVRPLRFATLCGTTISLLAFGYGLYAFAVFFLFEEVVSGWASLVSSILFLGGIQLIVLGIIGEYVGMLYVQSKQRPSYIIREESKDLTN
jgi:dolichol-phosphate mannosyltransferase